MMIAFIITVGQIMEYLRLKLSHLSGIMLFIGKKSCRSRALLVRGPDLFATLNPPAPIFFPLSPPVSLLFLCVSANDKLKYVKTKMLNMVFTRKTNK